MLEISQQQAFANKKNTIVDIMSIVNDTQLFGLGCPWGIINNTDCLKNDLIFKQSQTLPYSLLPIYLLTYTCKCVENLLASCKVSNIYVLTFSSCQKCKCPSYYICNALALYLWLLFPEEVSSLDFVILAILLTHWPNYICNLAAFTCTI